MDKIIRIARLGVSCPAMLSYYSTTRLACEDARRRRRGPYLLPNEPEKDQPCANVPHPCEPLGVEDPTA